MKIPEIVISLGGSAVFFVLLTCVAVALAVIFYRWSIPPLPRSKRITLAGLRALALTMLLLFLFEPLLRLITRTEQEPVLAVLVDNSQSMTIADRGVERTKPLRDFLAKNPFERFSRLGSVQYFGLSSKLMPIPRFSPDSLSFMDEVTDIASALEQLKTSIAEQNIQAAVVLTDGNFNVGKNPLSTAENLGIPLHTIGVGDTTEQRDVLVAKVTTNNIAYAGTRVPVDVRIRSAGYKDEKVEVTVSQGTTVVDRRILELQEGMRDYILSLGYEPTEEGVHRYTVTVSSLPGELTQKNNSASFFVRVLKTKLRLLIVAGAPSPDLSATRQILSEDEHFTVRSLIQKNSSEYYEGQMTASSIDSADCIVLIGYPSTTTSSPHVRLLAEEVSQKKKPVLFIGSKSLDPAKVRLIESVLPITISMPSPGEISIFAYVPEKNRSLLLVELHGAMTLDGWNQLPPIYKSQTVFAAKPEADVVAFAKIQGVALNEPLIAMRNIARQKSVEITGHGIWRWRLLAQGNAQTERFLSEFLTNAIRWLTTLDEGKNVRISPTKESFTSAEPVEFTAEVYDEQYRPVDGAEVRIEIGSKGERWETIMQNIGSGRYEGSIEGLGSGEYTFTGTAVRGETRIGEDRGRFTVGQLNLEFLETKMNKQLLEQMAFRTGATYSNLAGAESLVDTMLAHGKFSAKELSSSTELELAHWQYAAAALIVLFAIEWIIRKRSGLL
jgi:hypothetical protein